MKHLKTKLVVISDFAFRRIIKMLTNFWHKADNFTILEFVYGTTDVLTVSVDGEGSVIHRVEFKLELKTDYLQHYIILDIRKHRINASRYMAHETGDDYEMYYNPIEYLEAENGPVFSITDEMYRRNCPDIVKTTMSTLESEFRQHITSLTHPETDAMMFLVSLKAIFNL